MRYVTLAIRKRHFGTSSNHTPEASAHATTLVPFGNRTIIGPASTLVVLICVSHSHIPGCSVESSASDPSATTTGSKSPIRRSPAGGSGSACVVHVPSRPLWLACGNEGRMSDHGVDESIGYRR